MKVKVKEEGSGKKERKNERMKERKKERKKYKSEVAYLSEEEEADGGKDVVEENEEEDMVGSVRSSSVISIDFIVLLCTTALE